MARTARACITRTLVLVAVACARCDGTMPPEQAEQIRGGHWCCRSWDDCRARRATHRRIADALRADDAGAVAA